MQDAIASASSQTRARRIHHRLRPVDLLLFPVILAVLLMLIVPGWIAPGSPTVFNPTASLMPPGGSHLLGTDEFGRDVYTRIVHGARPTLVVAFTGALLGVVLGTLTGMLAGYAGGRVDEALMRFMDALMSFPTLILATLIVVMLGSNAVNVVAALAVVFWPRSARIIRAVAMDVARRAFIEAAWVRGESHLFILFREMLPSVMNVAVVDLSLRITYATMLSASLSYLGVGVHPPTPAWGLMVKEGQQFIQFASWLVVVPCTTIAIVAVACVLLGERLRELLAPAHRGQQ